MAGVKIMRTGDLNRLIRIQQKTDDNSFSGAGSEIWATVAEVAAQVQDMLPSRGERLADGLNIATRPARVRIRYRSGIDASMRVQVGRNVKNEAGELEWHTERTAQIVTQPAELGRREGLEFMIEDYSTTGGT